MQDIQPSIRSGAVATPRPSPSSKMAGYLIHCFVNIRTLNVRRLHDFSRLFSVSGKKKRPLLFWEKWTPIVRLPCLFMAQATSSLLKVDD
jgi:hypothetical protein